MTEIQTMLQGIRELPGVIQQAAAPLHPQLPRPPQNAPQREREAIREVWRRVGVYVTRSFESLRDGDRSQR